MPCSRNNPLEPWLRRLLAFGLILLSVQACAETAASVVFASGTPIAIAADGSSRKLERGSEVSSGETIDTADGRVQLRFRDGASMSLQPATRLRVNDYKFTGEDGRAGADDRSFLSLLKGGLRTITGLIGKGRREQYRVETVVATIGIRGTGYGATLADDGLRVTTFVGLVEVCNAGGCQLVHPGETALADHPERKPRLLGGGSALPANGDVVPQLPPQAVQQELPAGGRASPVGAGPATAPPNTYPAAGAYPAPPTNLYVPPGR